jgi:hypothetical protein
MGDTSQPWEAKLARDGFVVAPQVLASTKVSQLIAQLQRISAEEGVRQKSPGDSASRYAVRNLLQLAPAARELASWGEIRRWVEPILGPSAKAVRGILFDKTPSANWKVPWHQDLSIAVRERREVPGYGPWSMKAGVPHVQPSRHVLDNMLTVRLHLDECDLDNGPLRVLPGSHAEGVLSPIQQAAWRARGTEVACTVPAGGILLMRPLLMHASSPARAAGHRRVVHLEFAAAPLEGGLQWFEGEAA